MHTKMRMSLVPLSCALKNGYDGELYVIKNKKEEKKMREREREELLETGMREE